MSKKTYQKYIIGVLVILFVLAGYIIYITYIKPIPITVKPLPAKEFVTLYFYNPDTDTLKPEQRTIVQTTGVLETCSVIIGELERGSNTGLTTPIPVDVKVNDASLQPNGILFIDLSKNLISETPEGSSAEITAIYSIVNSIAKNINGVKAVQITIDGKLLQTLETHIEIDQPIIPDYTK
jgi:spore germination protein GerM